MKINLKNNLDTTIGQTFRRELSDNFTKIENVINENDNKSIENLHNHKNTELNAHSSKQIKHVLWDVDQELKYRAAQIGNLVLGANGDGIAETKDARVAVFSKKAHATLSERLLEDFLLIKNQMDHNSEEIEKRERYNSVYQKEVFAQLPAKFKGYDNLVKRDGALGFYPQSFTIDWVNREILVLQSPTGGSNKRYILFYDMDTLEHKACLQIGYAGGEGLVVKSNVKGRRLIYAKSVNHKLGEYIVDDFPAENSTVLPNREFDINVEWQFNYNNGVWIISDVGADLGAHNGKYVFTLFDDDFNRIGTFISPISNGGYFETKLASELPKRQGIAIANGRVYFGMGGWKNDGGFDSFYTDQGWRSFSMDGTILEDSMVSSKKMVEILNANDIKSTFTENEGIYVNPENGDIYTITVNLKRDDVDANTKGILILKEKATSDKAIDFSSAASTAPSINASTVSLGIHPRTGDGLVNPLTGELLSSMHDIFEYMKVADIPKISFYSSAVLVNDINGIPFASGKRIEILNNNNIMFIMTEYGNSLASTKCYIYNTSNSKSISKTYIKEIKDRFELTLLNGATSLYTTELPVVTVNNAEQVLIEGSLTIANYVKGMRNATIPQGLNPVAFKTYTVPINGGINSSNNTATIKIGGGEIVIVNADMNVAGISLNGIGYSLRNDIAAEQNRWRGKKILFIGDSITAGSTATLKYPTLISQQLKVNTANDGVVGSTWSNGTTTQSIPPIVDRLVGLDLVDVTHVVIFAGTNDFGRNVKLGKSNDITSSTFYGAINNSIKQLKQLKSTLEIAIVTPIPRYDGRKNEHGHTLNDFVEALVDKSKEFNLPCLDLSILSGINNNNKDIYLSSDMLHPNDNGQRLLADKIGNFIDAQY